MMDVSVIVCTYRRPRSLGRLLQSLTLTRMPTGLNWELLVVDNHSRDQTAAVAAGFADRLPLRYLEEPGPGLNRARNRGLEQALGQLLVFTDDDVEVSPGWVAAYQQAALRHPAAVYFSGRILPRFEVEPPAWLRGNTADVLRAVAVHYDLGGQERALAANSHESPFGANMAFRARVFEGADQLRFPVGVGTCGYDQLLRGDETAVFEQLQSRRQLGVYVPAAEVYHWLPAERLTRAYVRRWFEDNGRSRVLFGAAAISWRQVYWDWAYNQLRYALCRWSLPSGLWLRAERNRWVARGILRQMRQREQKLVPGEGIEPPTKGL